MSIALLASVIPVGSELLTTAASVAGWAIFGVFLSVIALKIFDLITPGKLEVLVFKDGNTAAAIVYGAALITCGIIIASAMH
ncbi:MAG: DUF350 domain-containing protein [Opitutus sp.]|nr:DUF350 domain-containing protein [Opitutus sp.]MCS6246401.1 DUF350 domain-containing protein [Opitutus sp.]MCS6273259.1 DUF350 domain-containing protein [Opitutus sp.]MCS6277965.1 DUF350 domain-containing protein [Opitutus sp.]MCS6298928.1 DUF350 domain-containing protein [Opitutus sp.]